MDSKQLKVSITGLRSAFLIFPPEQYPPARTLSDVSQTSAFAFAFVPTGAHGTSRSRYANHSYCVFTFIYIIKNKVANLLSLH